MKSIKKIVNKILEKRFARFFAVGVWNTFVDLFVLTIMVKLTNAQPDQTLKLVFCNTVSGTASITSSFLMNRYFVFKDSHNPIEGKKLLTFIVVSIIGAYGINNTVLNLVVLHATWLTDFTYSIVSFVRLDSILSQNFVKIFTGKAIAGLCSMLWSFWAYGRFVFKKDD